MPLVLCRLSDLRSPPVCLPLLAAAAPAQITSELCDVLAAKVGGDEGATVDVAEAAMRITLDVIGTTGYGYDFKARQYKECELFEVQYSAVQQHMAFSAFCQCCMHRSPHAWPPPQHCLCAPLPACLPACLLKCGMPG